MNLQEAIEARHSVRASKLPKATQQKYQPVLHKKTFQELTTDELYELLRVRSEVFVVEQNCVYQDMDNDDQESIHLWLTLEDRIPDRERPSPALRLVRQKMGMVH